MNNNQTNNEFGESPSEEIFGLIAEALSINLEM